MDWHALLRLDDLPTVFFKMSGGAAWFEGRGRINFDHADGGLGWNSFSPCFVVRKVSAIAGIYGWSQKIDSSTLLATTILEGSHIDAFRGEANLAAIADGVAAMVAAAARSPASPS